MENIIGLVIFLAVAGISAYSKHLETKKAERERANRPVVNPEDLPEETRRVLYGETGVPPRKGQRPGHDIPMARRKGAAPPAPPAPPREGPVVRQGGYYGEGPVRGEETTSPVFSEEQRLEELRRKLQEKLQQQWAQEQRRKAAQAQAEKEARRKAAPPRPQQRPQRPTPAAVRTLEHREGAPSPEEGPRVPIPQVRQEEAASQQRRPPATATVRRLVHNPRALKQAIIVREVLGPPVGLR